MKLLAAIGAVAAVLVVLPLVMVLIAAGIVAPAVVAGVLCGPTTPAAEDLPSGGWRPPLTSRYRLTSPYGRRFHPVYRQWRLHTGQDLAAIPAGSAVVAAGGGSVTAAGRGGAYGNRIIVDHGGGITSMYGHLARIDPRIRPGATVTTGQRLGVEGATGTATGIHLHFQIERDGTPIDPVRFMHDHGAPLNGRAVRSDAGVRAPVSTALAGLNTDAGEGGIGFDLPKPGSPRQDSLHNPPLPIPARIEKLYRDAADRYRIPWTLLAGIGMEETGHGRNNRTSSAGAQGLMQFMPATWASMGVDGDRDGRADIHNDADSVFSAANYLTKSGVKAGAAGVRRALFAYNHTTWYVNDVLYYAHHYGGGTMLGDPNDCGAQGDGDPNLPPLTDHRIAAVLGWATTPRRRAVPDGRQRTGRLRLLLLHPSRVRPDRDPDAAHRRRATQLARRRQRHPHPPRPRTTRRPGLLGLLPRPEHHRPRHDRRRPGAEADHRSPQHPRRHRLLLLHRRAAAPHL